MLLGTSILWQVEAPILYERYVVEVREESFDIRFIDRDTAASNRGLNYVETGFQGVLSELLV